MKKYSFFLLIGLVVTLFSCSKETDPIEDFVGSWSAEDKWTVDNTTTTRNYNFTVSRGIDDSEIQLNGFAEITGGTLTANVNGRNFTVPEFSITVTLDDEELDGTFSASGSVDGNKMTYTYTFQAGMLSQVWEGEATK